VLAVHVGGTSEIFGKGEEGKVNLFRKVVGVRMIGRGGGGGEGRGRLVTGSVVVLGRGEGIAPKVVEVVGPRVEGPGGRGRRGRRRREGLAVGRGDGEIIVLGLLREDRRRRVRIFRISGEIFVRTDRRTRKIRIARCVIGRHGDIGGHSGNDPDGFF
jgi:hypothetical protein